MQKHWFQPDNAGALRAHIKTIILELFLGQVSRPVSLPACLWTHCTLTNGSSLSSHRFGKPYWFFQQDAAWLIVCRIKGSLWSLQVPNDQKEALADALTLARKEVEEYKEDSQVPK